MEKIKIIDFGVIALSLVGILFIVGYSTPSIIAPISDFNTTDSSVLFKFKNADTILIDDNMEFTSPTTLKAENDLVVSLKPGKYYWKIKGITESTINSFTIISKIDLRLRAVGEEYEVTNAGNTVLNVEVYNGTILKEEFVLNTNENKNSSGTLFLGREDA